ncbi:hypothetical protein ACFP3I_07540 [Chryseobacterium arachidis]|uniref:hypothetical protein n=1 Tax=Chryseobacterium arachidis TaxID=1416778 RepID=UPI00361C5D4E
MFRPFFGTPSEKTSFFRRSTEGVSKKSRRNPSSMQSNLIKTGQNQSSFSQVIENANSRYTFVSVN